jgi:hypothetical protein
MVDVINFYIDDSGTRHPDRNPMEAAHGYDWFGLGGVLIKQEDEAEVEAAHERFCAGWPLTGPLHSSSIRGKAEDFHWLKALPQEDLELFIEQLYHLMSMPQLLGMACVVDRPGYNHRYLDQYGRQRWSLCKTAFAVAVERAAKYARSLGYKLKVFVERSDEKTDRWMRNYYDDLRHNGCPFDAARSGKYQPLEAAILKETLYDFKIKFKSSPLMQLADLYLWPMCIGGYDRGNRTYSRLLADGRLIDCILPAEAVGSDGIKYSCWELAAHKKTKARKTPDLRQPPPG